MTFHSSWPPDRVERLKALIHDGLSSGLIGEKLGVSRSAVCGEARRLGLRLSGAIHKPHSGGPGGPRKPRDITPRKTKALKSVAANVKARAKALPARPCAGIHLFDLRYGQCRWPMWADNEQTNFTYCGTATRFGGTYCREHLRRMKGQAA